jgi:hypothetical protein
MLFRQKFLKKLFTVLALTACTLGSTYAIASAQSGSGFSIIKKQGVDELNYFLDFGGQRNARDRYRLRIPGNKLLNGAAKFYVIYQDHFDGKFDTDDMEVRIDNEPLPLRNVIWDEESRTIEIELEQPLRESRKVELVFSNVRNPDVGTYYFFCQVLPASDLPVREQLGAWIISINP